MQNTLHTWFMTPDTSIDNKTFAWTIVNVQSSCSLWHLMQSTLYCCIASLFFWTRSHPILENHSTLDYLCFVSSTIDYTGHCLPGMPLSAAIFSHLLLIDLGCNLCIFSTLGEYHHNILIAILLIAANIGNSNTHVYFWCFLPLGKNQHSKASRKPANTSYYDKSMLFQVNLTGCM